MAFQTTVCLTKPSFPKATGEEQLPASLAAIGVICMVTRRLLFHLSLSAELEGRGGKQSRKKPQGESPVVS